MNEEGRLAEKGMKWHTQAIAVAALLLIALAMFFALLPAGNARAVSAQEQKNTAQPQDCGLLWRVVPSLNGGTNINELAGVAAISASDVWAVGSYSEVVTGGAQRFRTMIQHWDGSVWSTVTAPQPGIESNLYAVSGVSANDVWAVGYYWPSSTDTIKTFTLHWDGSSWTQIPSPNISSLGQFVFGVHAVASDAVWAVGMQSGQSLVLFWDGTTWASIPAPSPDTETRLLGVTATTADDMWAVGYSASDHTPQRTFTIHCTRAQCDEVASPNSGVGDTALEGVSAVSSSEVYAVGYSTVSTTTDTVEPLALRWNGVGWSELPTAPSPPSMQKSSFRAVTAISSGDVWAVGNTLNSTVQQGQTYAAHWNGTAWTMFSPPNLGSSNGFAASAALGSNDLWAVGLYSNGGNVSQTLIEHYSDPCVTPTPSPTPPSSCTIQFTDVPADNTFYAYVICLACRGIINGYPCGGAGEPCDANNNPYFRPSNPVSRGQLAKIVSNSAGFADTPAGQTFEDVPVGSAFYDFVGRLASRDVMGGYACGGVGEPCGSGNLPYFRPGAGATRGQLTKIVSNAAGFMDAAPPTYTFTDVPVGSTFHLYVERLLLNRPGVMGGYACGGSGEPCDSENRSYFRPASPLTRGQTSKIVGNTFFPDCQTP